MNQKLKVGELLAINSQDDLNDLARLTGAFEEDSILIDGEYVAYTDFDGSVEGMIYVVPIGEFRSMYPNFDKKPRKFKSWARSLM